MVKTLSPETIAIIGISILHLAFFPFTKVEESFNVQSIHDFIYIGFSKFLSKINVCLGSQPSNFTTWPKWDHEDFPGKIYLILFITFH